MNEQPNQPFPVVGDLFSMSWGYDQTNVNYFQVTRVTPKGVYVREIGQLSVPGTQGFMCETVQPNKDSFLERSQWCGGFDDKNSETFRRVKWSKYFGWFFNFKGRYFAHMIIGGTGDQYKSWYA